MTTKTRHVPFRLVAAALLAAACAGPAAAANLACTKIGNVVHCSDGSRGTEIGNVYRHQSGPSASGAVEEVDPPPPAERICRRIGDKEFCLYAARGNDCRIVDGRPTCAPAGR